MGDGEKKKPHPCCLICFGLGFVVLGMVALGWNEHRTVCQSAALILAEDNYVSAKCDEPPSTYAGKFVHLSCPIDSTKLRTYSVGDVDSKHEALSQAVGQVRGMCLEQRMSVYQCTEQKSNHCIGKVKPSSSVCHNWQTNFRYTMAYKSEFVDSSAFYKRKKGGISDTAKSQKQAACGPEENPTTDSFPFNPLQATAPTQQSVEMGAWTLDREQVERLTGGGKCNEVVPLQRPTELKSFQQAPKQPVNRLTLDNVWVDSEHTLRTCKPDNPRLGCIEVQFLTKAPKHVSLLYRVASDGTFRPFNAPATWMCGPAQVSTIADGAFTVLELFERLANEENMMKWGLRIFGFFMIFSGIFLFLSPIEWLASHVPFVGSWFRGAVGCVLVTIALLTATGLSLMVISVAWVVMRPLLGIPLLVAGLSFFGFAPCLMRSSSKDKDI